MGREDAKRLESVFFSFCQKIKDGKAGWQTVGDALSSVKLPSFCLEFKQQISIEFESVDESTRTL
jgi:hypothetical protein